MNPPAVTRLEPPKGYSPDSQRVVGLLAAGLDDQTRLLVRAVSALPVPCLEWQPRPGHNTVGMLLAHIAITEAWWILAAPACRGDREEARRIVQDAISLDLDDDGMPAPADGRHPGALHEWAVADYVATLERARAATHAALRSSWHDASLGEEVVIRAGERAVTKGWILYHVLEHTAAHAGQVGRLLHDLRDAGLLPPA